MTTKSFICQNWLDCDMNYMEHESYGLVTITPDQAKGLLEYRKLLNDTVIEVVLASEGFACPEFYQDVDISYLGIPDVDLDNFTEVPSEKITGVVRTCKKHKTCDDKGIVGNVSITGMTDASEVEDTVIHVSKTGVVWSVHLVDDEVRATTAALSFEALESVTGKAKPSTAKKRGQRSRKG